MACKIWHSVEHPSQALKDREVPHANSRRTIVETRPLARPSPKSTRRDHRHQTLSPGAFEPLAKASRSLRDADTCPRRVEGATERVGDRRPVRARAVRDRTTAQSLSDACVANCHSCSPSRSEQLASRSPRVAAILRGMPTSGRPTSYRRLRIICIMSTDTGALPLQILNAGRNRPAHYSAR